MTRGTERESGPCTYFLPPRTRVRRSAKRYPARPNANPTGQRLVVARSYRRTTFRENKGPTLSFGLTKPEGFSFSTIPRRRFFDWWLLGRWLLNRRPRLVFVWRWFGRLFLLFHNRYLGPHLNRSLVESAVQRPGKSLSPLGEASPPGTRRGVQTRRRRRLSRIYRTKDTYGPGPGFYSRQSDSIEVNAYSQKSQPLLFVV